MPLIGSLIEEGGVGAHAQEPALVAWSHTENRITKRVTFAEFAFIANEVAEALRAHGVRRGDPVAMLSHPTLSYFTTVAGVLSLGAVAVNINWRQSEESMQYMASLGRSTRVLSSAHFIKSGVAGRLLKKKLPTAAASSSLLASDVILLGQLSQAQLTEVQSNARNMGHSVVPLFSHDSSSHSSRRHEEGGAASNSGGSHSHLGQADVAAIMFTSGSTAPPKGVPLTHQGLIWSCERKLEAHCPGQGRRRGSGRSKGLLARGTLSFLPNFHVMGFTNNFLFNVCVARVPALVHEDCETVPLSLEVTMRACIGLRPSLVDTIPHMLEALAVLVSKPPGGSRGGGRGDDNDDDDEGLDSDNEDEDEEALSAAAAAIDAFAACERVLFGGCALSSTAFEVLSERGVKLASQYGQTELGGMIAIGEPPCLGGKRSEMRIVPGCSFRMEGEGELVLLNCEAAMLDYLPSPLTTEAAGAATAAAAATASLPAAAGGNALVKAVHRTNDLFDIRTAHDDDDDAGRSVGGGGGGSMTTMWLTHRCRQDDLILHTSGEMTNPLPLEDVLSSSLVPSFARKLCVGGQQRPYPVLFVERNAPNGGNRDSSSSSSNLSSSSLSSSFSYSAGEDALFRKALATSLKACNAQAPAYSKLLLHRVIVLGYDNGDGGDSNSGETLTKATMPTSAKGNVLRKVLEKQHAVRMDALDLDLLLPSTTTSDKNKNKNDLFLPTSAAKALASTISSTNGSLARRGIGANAEGARSGGGGGDDDYGSGGGGMSSLVTVTFSDDDEDDEEEAPDSITITKTRNDKANSRRVVNGYILAFCMFSVLQAHSLWPRQGFWPLTLERGASYEWTAQTSALPCGEGGPEHGPHLKEKNKKGGGGGGGDGGYGFDPPPSRHPPTSRRLRASSSSAKEKKGEKEEQKPEHGWRLERLRFGVHPFLLRLHAAPEMVCMPGFVIVAALDDLRLWWGKKEGGSGGSKRVHAAAAAQALARKAAVLLLAYFAARRVADSVAGAYLNVGTDCGGAAMSKVLWYLPFLALCRALQATALLLQVPPLLLGALVLVAHLGLWGHPSLHSALAGGGEGAWPTADFLLDECKTKNYAVYYFVVAPLLHRCGVPTLKHKTATAAWLWRGVTVCLALALPWALPGWFDTPWQFLSEASKSGPLLDFHSHHRHDHHHHSASPPPSLASSVVSFDRLSEHFLQVLASTLLLIGLFQSVPRKPSVVSSVLGKGTFSCFLLHWWLRPVWLTLLTAWLQFVARHVAGFYAPPSSPSPYSLCPTLPPPPPPSSPQPQAPLNLTPPPGATDQPLPAPLLPSLCLAVASLLFLFALQYLLSSCLLLEWSSPPRKSATAAAAAALKKEKKYAKHGGGGGGGGWGCSICVRVRAVVERLAPVGKSVLWVAVHVCLWALAFQTASQLASPPPPSPFPLGVNRMLGNASASAAFAAAAKSAPPYPPSLYLGNKCAAFVAHSRLTGLGSRDDADFTPWRKAHKKRLNSRDQAARRHGSGYNRPQPEPDICLVQHREAAVPMGSCDRILKSLFPQIDAIPLPTPRQQQLIKQILLSSAPPTSTQSPSRDYNQKDGHRQRQQQQQEDGQQRGPQENEKGKQKQQQQQSEIENFIQQQQQQQGQKGNEKGKKRQQHQPKQQKQQEKRQRQPAQNQQQGPQESEKEQKRQRQQHLQLQERQQRQQQPHQQPRQQLHQQQGERRRLQQRPQQQPAYPPEVVRWAREFKQHASKLQGDPSKHLHALVPCLNRAYACEHGYSFLVPSTPWMNVLQASATGSFLVSSTETAASALASLFLEPSFASLWGLVNTVVGGDSSDGAPSPPLHTQPRSAGELSEVKRKRDAVAKACGEAGSVLDPPGQSTTGPNHKHAASAPRSKGWCKVLLLERAMHLFPLHCRTAAVFLDEHVRLVEDFFSSPSSPSSSSSMTTTTNKQSAQPLQSKSTQRANETRAVTSAEALAAAMARRRRLTSDEKKRGRGRGGGGDVGSSDAEEEWRGGGGLGRQPEVAAFLRSDKALFVAQKPSPPSPPSSVESLPPQPDDASGDSSAPPPALPSTSLVIARNSRKGRQAVRDWWRSVDDFGSVLMNTTAGGVTGGGTGAAGGGDRGGGHSKMRPLRHFRVGGFQEESVLSGFLNKRYPGDVVVSSHVEYYETSSGVFARNTAKHQKRWQDAADSSSAEGVSETHGGTLVSLFDAAVSLLAARRRSHKHGCDASGART